MKKSLNEEKEAPIIKKLFFIWKSIGKYWWAALLTPIVMALEGIFVLQIPDLSADIIDYLKSVSDANEAVDMSVILNTSLWLVIYTLCALACGILGVISAATVSAGFTMNLKNRIFKKVDEFSFTNIDKYSSASLITRMNTDTQYVQFAFFMMLRIAFWSIAIFIYALIKAYRVSNQIGLVFLIAIPFVFIALMIIHMSAHKHFERGVKEFDNINSITEENLRGIRVVKSFTRESDEIKKFDIHNNALFKHFVRGETIVGLTSPVMMFAIYGVILFLSLIASKYISLGTMTTGNLYELISYGLNIMQSLMMFSMVFVFFTISRPSTNRIYEVLMEEPTILNPTNPIYEVKDGTVDFDHVYFKYNESSEKYVLDDVDLHIKSGETIGILGTTGSSKTSLISLIARLYDVSKGSVKVGGVDVRCYDIKSLRHNVSVVLQKNVLFSGTIKDNIRWGKEDATDEEIEKVCRQAKADEFIESFPDKYDTYIEQGGSNVSGGQKQRLCIARALMKKPKILILDDSTSAVDTKTESQIRKAFKEELPETTKIIIAQRISSVEDCDRIIVMEDGKINQIGTHKELLRSNEIYKEVYESQQKGDE